MTTKTAIITGSGSGMGQACAEYFLSQGWKVIGLDRQQQVLDHPAFRAATVDICNEESISKALDDLLEDNGIDALVNAAGVFPTSNLESYSEELYRHIFDINVLGSLNTARCASQRMVNGGSILFFASVDAFAVSRNQLLYSASKAAVVSLTKSLAVELAERNIVVNAVAPGWVETPGTLAGGRIQEGIKSVPLKRAAQPAEIAEWIYRFSAEPGYVSGETLCISGGVIVR